ncbi:MULTISPECIES: [protein-PII] uridylyltransferase [unclassified Oleiphilus]|uniref:[protein-PII] uridylyltransferase n=7 Tax=Oleiphilus TaxID=141450 RepID=UPI0009EE1B5D|nr:MULTISPECIES: [protein-PII] uridylyltransferase [unclassified Oleiphilus]
MTQHSSLFEKFTHASSLDMQTLVSDLSTCSQPALNVRTILEDSKQVLDQLYLANEDIRQLIEVKSKLMDYILKGLWARFGFDQHVSLIAVGGYGRGELQPHSDIDLLILVRNEIDDQLGTKLSDFITLLWDLKLDIGHSVRTIDECIEAAKSDVTIATNLLETRTIDGDPELLSIISDKVYSDAVYTSKAYFLAKREEQSARHLKYSGTEYNLEPNLKSSPGTLRDIQTITWISKRHFGAEAPSTRSRYHFLTDEEFRMLVSGETFLLTLRYGLQIIADRNENRLLFEHQRKLAEILGFEDDEQKLGVEKMMQRYYRIVLGLAELTDVILQYFDEFYLNPESDDSVQELGKRFQINHGYIEAKSEDIFDRSPYALIEIFLLLAQNPQIIGIKTTTIRQIREHQYLIDDSFRNDLANTSLFMEILRTPHDLHKTLNAMLKYNVLGRYLPEFGQIIGQMQHDLFHCYTVDAHTIQLIKNLIHLDYPEAKKEFPLACRLYRYIPKREILYTAGIYHDIAKGRGGDHSELGAIDVENFCQNHHFSERDTRLTSWLVENHLLMSMTAQKKDIDDPEVIHQFAQLIPSLTHLEYLYILTVCDISATNHTLWNSWRATLMQQLYIETRRAIRRGTDKPVDRNDWIEATKREVRTLLIDSGYTTPEIDALLESFEDDYFLQDSTADIVWQISEVLNHGSSSEPLIIIRDTQTMQGDGFSHVMVYVRSKDDLFAATTAVLEQLNLNVLNARISASRGEFNLSHFIVTDAHNMPLANDVERKEQVRSRLIEELDDPEDYPEIISRRTPRQLKHFAFPTEVTFSNDMINQRTVMEVVTPDRPGLLARIGQALLKHNLSLINARIATLGERVEDVFFITDTDGQPLSDAMICEALQHDICTLLDEQVEITS